MSLCQRQKHGWTPGYRKHLYQDQPKGQSEEPDQVGISYSGLRIGGEVERFKLVDLSPDCAIEQILAVSLSLSERDEIASDPEKEDRSYRHKTAVDQQGDGAQLPGARLSNLANKEGANGK
jgi:hypothetical protein